MRGKQGGGGSESDQDQQEPRWTGAQRCAGGLGGAGTGWKLSSLAPELPGTSWKHLARPTQRCAVSRCHLPAPPPACDLGSPGRAQLNRAWPLCAWQLAPWAPPHPFSHLTPHARWGSKGRGAPWAATHLAGSRRRLSRSCVPCSPPGSGSGSCRRYSHRTRRGGTRSSHTR